MSSAWVPSFEKEHLWMYLQALGFEPGSATVAGGKIVSHTHLGVLMNSVVGYCGPALAAKFLLPVAASRVARDCYGTLPGALFRGVESAVGAKLKGRLIPALVVKPGGL
ncbi:hypothetical protein J1605_001277 [Eschrichtius robustus]|uniref:Uncharacterized protein n=1 Tax=Eschrichtius robustus TaxID=9764 RepID=A0AB34G854_ESCRO|nr:hypothetical protein J1605_001277 [Eschrichtius robustus]